MPAVLVVEESNQYQKKEYEIKTAGRRYAYITDTLIERKYGQLTLELGRSDNDFIINLENQRGKVIASGNSFDEAVEIGNYTIKLSHRESPEEYQTITDAPLLVRENQHVRRSYQTPLYRQPWKSGKAYMLNYGFGAKLGDEYLLPTANDTETRMADFKIPGCSGGCPGQSFHLQDFTHIDLQAFKLFSPGSLMVSGSIGISTADFKVDKRHEISLWGVGSSVGAGFWTSQLGNMSWISANYKAEYMHWDDSGSIIQQMNMDSYMLNTYPYLEAGILLGVISAGIRIPDPAMAAPEFFIGFGGETIKSGYKHSAATQASKGVHY